jgi:uncharacterized protein YidB (DUF937 family)
MSLNIGKAAIALGALLAYQNRDKIGDLLRGGRDPNSPQSEGGGVLDGVFGGEGPGGALKDVLDRFRGAGSEKEVDSWVGREPNHPLQKAQVESAIDAETLDQLAAQTGLSREELIDRITRDLPKAVDALTPDGRLPDAAGDRPSNGNLLDDVPAGKGVVS